MTPEKIEGVYLSSNSLLTQLFVHGDFYRHILLELLVSTLLVSAAT